MKEYRTSEADILIYNELHCMQCTFVSVVQDCFYLILVEMSIFVLTYVTVVFLYYAYKSILGIILSV